MTSPTETTTAAAASVDDRNRAFWDELCGSHAARLLGITDASPASLKRFDDWFFGFYPYVDRYIPFGAMRGQRVLEVGIGYGSVSQRLAEAGARFVGLDVAAGPIAIAIHRLRQSGLSGAAYQGSVLEAPFADESFDVVVAIGCYHHTGNLQRSLDETWRVLKPGGTAVIMIYSAYSYRRWMQAFGSTLRYLLWDKLGLGAPPEACEAERARYDIGSDGRAAPETVFTSISHLKRIAKGWKRVRVRRENIGAEGLLQHLERPLACRLLGPWLGLDLYATLEK